MYGFSLSLHHFLQFVINIPNIAIDKPCSYIREGVFFISLHKVGLTNQDGGINEQAAGANVQDGDADEQGGANEQNDEQGGGTNERNDEQ
ncbi:hypothetical protein H5410_034343 [Solanum commersonii]|uniref:Uncharacterized protein n=1 Tax=Solanum commersonii TaxID=4109 RepID=A0A9J5YT08_SOLCO|nr:hypothetical protein H5410_034343 [Solanum commersonii]